MTLSYRLSFPFENIVGSNTVIFSDTKAKIKVTIFIVDRFTVLMVIMKMTESSL